MVENTEPAQKLEVATQLPTDPGSAVVGPSVHRQTRFVGILEHSELIGGFAWIEGALFEVIGGWSADEVDPSIAVAFADHARRHSWHSEVLFERLPELANVDAEALVRPPTDGHLQIVDQLRCSTGTLDRLVGAYRVMCAHLLADYGRLSDDLGVVSAPSARRWLGFIRADLMEQWLWGESRIRETARSLDALDGVLMRQRELESLLL